MRPRFHPSSPLFFGFLVLATTTKLACSTKSDPDTERRDPEGDGSLGGSNPKDGTGGAPSNLGGGDNSGEIVLMGGFGGQSPSPQVDTDTPEICDGIDNDKDGQIDNVDVGGDGICDCLNIGTIGHIGPWSDGGDIFKDWLDERSPIPAFELGDQELTDDLLMGLNILVVLRVDTAPLEEDDSEAHHAFSPSEVEALTKWVEAGGGLMTTIGYQGNEVAEVVNVNRLLEPLGGGYDSDQTDLDGGFLEVWDEEHPISNGISQIHVQNGVRPLSDVGQVVAWGAGEKAGVVVHEVKDGRVIVFGDEWITYDSEWVDTEEQQVELLWLNMLKWLSPPRECQVEIPPELIVR